MLWLFVLPLSVDCLCGNLLRFCSVNFDMYLQFYCIMKGFSFSARIKSFGYALAGLRYLISTQHNAWIHLVLTVIVVALGFFLHLNTTEWCLIIVAIGLVLLAEAFNTAIEVLTDLVSPHYHAKAKIVKDVSAGAVLVAALMAAVIGFIVFFPKLLDCL